MKPDTEAQSKVEPAVKTGMPLPDTVAVEEPTTKKKRKKKYTKGSRDFQELGHALSKSAFRMSNAVALGLDTFYRRQSKSARRKRDGMVRDGFKNMARGFRDAAGEAAKAPYDIAKRVDVWRQARTGLRLVQTIFIPR